MGLETAPAKLSDSRAKDWRSLNGDGISTVQAEAIPPRVLAEIVRNAAETSLDTALIQEMRDQEQEDIADMSKLAERLTE